jgi:hypothetical protein
MTNGRYGTIQRGREVSCSAMGYEIWKQMEKKLQEKVLKGRSYAERAAWRTGADKCPKKRVTVHVTKEASYFLSGSR